MANWVDEEVAFYDFIWKEAIGACGNCITEELLEDFQEGGNKFEEMKVCITKEFPTREIAVQAFQAREPR